MNTTKLKTDINVIFAIEIITIIVSIITFIIFYSAEVETYNEVNARLIELENTLSNYHEECYENITVEKYKVINESCNDIYFQFCANPEGPRIQTCETLHPLYCHKIEKPYIEFYNETICNKYVLVRG